MYYSIYQRRKVKYREKNDMIKGHIALYWATIPFITKRNQSIISRLDSTFIWGKESLLSSFIILYTVILEIKFKQKVQV